VSLTLLTKDVCLNIHFHLKNINFCYLYKHQRGMIRSLYDSATVAAIPTYTIRDIVFKK